MKNIRDHYLLLLSCDAKNDLFPLTFAIAKKEGINAQAWFLDQIVNFVTNQTGLCIISDQFMGLVTVVSEQFPAELGHVHYHCLYHMRANLAKTHKKPKLLKKFYELRAKDNMTKFYKRLEKIKKTYVDGYKWMIE